ncbi:MAG: DMT family transporter [Anderseniella sp.]|nr:DMT family transporter [Anderseniella sp.]
MQKATILDVFLWLALATMWSSSYAVIKLAITTIDSSVLVAGRMLVGTIIIFIVLKARGLSLSWSKTVWSSYAITGLLGSALPFLLITHGEQSVDSALASILMGVAPVITLLVAAWLIPDEALTLRIAFGVVGGFLGVAVLVGPAALAGLGDQLEGQSAIIGATFCYAASTVYIRRFVSRPPLEMATGSMIVGTIFICTVVLLSGADVSSIEPTLPSLGALIYLGVFSTAFANLTYFYLVPRLGATRMSQVNFAVPVGGAVLGFLILGEALTTQRAIALAIIIGSVYLSTTTSRSHGLK